jgi:hypothetical protein
MNKSDWINLRQKQRQAEIDECLQILSKLNKKDIFFSLDELKNTIKKLYIYCPDGSVQIMDDGEIRTYLGRDMTYVAEVNYLNDCDVAAARDLLKSK